MSILYINITEGESKTYDGETLNYRIYSGGGVKIEEENMREDFSNLFGTNEYIKLNNIKIFL